MIDRKQMMDERKSLMREFRQVRQAMHVGKKGKREIQHLREVVTLSRGSNAFHTFLLAAKSIYKPTVTPPPEQ